MSVLISVIQGILRFAGLASMAAAVLSKISRILLEVFPPSQLPPVYKTHLSKLDPVENLRSSMRMLVGTRPLAA